MKIIIIGDGKVGLTLTECLAQEGHDIMVIDKDAKLLENVVNNYDVMGVCGNGTSHEALLEAGADKADLVIAATSSDEINMLSCFMAKKIGTQNTIARVRNPEYAKQLAFLKEDLGLSMIVNPEFEAARDIARILRFPSAMKIEYFSKGRIDLAEIRIPENGHLAGKRLSELYKVCKEKILICAVQRGEEVVIPGGDFVIQAGDHIHITGSHAALEAFFKAIGMFKQRSKNVLVVGGGKVAYYLARHLEDNGVNIKIIEQSEDRCVHLAEVLPRTTVICGDGTDYEVLKEEGLLDSDACVVLTGIDEENMVVSLYAKSQGVKTVIAKIDRQSFAEMAETMGVDTHVSPKSVTANRIVRYVRAMQDSGESAVKTLYKIVDQKVEALEFSAGTNAPYLNVPLRDLETKEGMLFAGIIRRGKVIIPGGDDCLMAGDSVLIVTTQSGVVTNLEDIFA